MNLKYFFQWGGVTEGLRALDIREARKIFWKNIQRNPAIAHCLLLPLADMT